MKKTEKILIWATILLIVALVCQAQYYNSQRHKIEDARKERQVMSEH